MMSTQPKLNPLKLDVCMRCKYRFPNIRMTQAKGRARGQCDKFVPHSIHLGNSTIVSGLVQWISFIRRGHESWTHIASSMDEEPLEQNTRDTTETGGERVTTSAEQSSRGIRKNQSLNNYPKVSHPHPSLHSPMLVVEYYWQASSETLVLPVWAHPVDSHNELVPSSRSERTGAV